MKEYRKDIETIDNDVLTAPIYFTLDQGDPQVGSRVALVYGAKGNYLGYTTPEVIRPYIYGQLYYKAKRQYKVETISSRRRRYTPITRYVIEKASNARALTILEQTITNEMLVDMDVPAAKAQITLDVVREVVPTIYNITSPPNRFGVLDSEIIRVNKELQVFLKLKYKEYEEYLAKHISLTNNVHSIASLRQKKVEPVVVDA